MRVARKVASGHTRVDKHKFPFVVDKVTFLSYKDWPIEEHTDEMIAAAFYRAWLRYERELAANNSNAGGITDAQLTKEIIKLAGDSADLSSQYMRRCAGKVCLYLRENAAIPAQIVHKLIVMNPTAERYHRLVSAIVTELGYGNAIHY